MSSHRASVYLRKRKSGYSAIFYDPDRNPQQKYVTLRTKDKTAARRRLTDLEQRYSLGEFDPWSDRAPEEGLFVSEVIERFIKLKSETCRPKTVEGYWGTLQSFLRSLPPGMLVNHVEGRHCRAFFNRQGLSATSKNTYARQLRTFFKWCVGEGYLKASPVEDLAVPKAPKKVISYLTRPQYERLCAAVGSHLVLEAKYIQLGEVAWFLDLLKVAVSTGLRSGEIRSMRWSWVDLEGGTISVKATTDFRPKSGNERVIYFSGEAREVLDRRNRERGSEEDSLVIPGLNGGKINGHYLAKRFRFFRDLAKLPKHLHFHSTRHTYASWLVQGGVDLYRVKELCGHQSMQTTIRYAHLAPKNLRQAVEQVFGS